MRSIFKVEIRSFKEESEVGLASKKKIEPQEEEVKRLGSEEEEDTFIGGVVVAGGASQKARKKRKKKKLKSKTASSAREEEVKEDKQRIEGEDLKGASNLTKEEWKAYCKRVEAKCELENAEEEEDP